MGVMLVPRTAKYKSISVSTDTYNQIVQMATKHHRNISQQLALVVSEEYDRQGLKPKPRMSAYSGGLSAVMED